MQSGNNLITKVYAHAVSPGEEGRGGWREEDAERRQPGRGDRDGQILRVDVLTREILTELIRERSQGCVSLFMPTHRAGSEEFAILTASSMSRARMTASTGPKISSARIVESGGRSVRIVVGAEIVIDGGMTL